MKTTPWDSVSNRSAGKLYRSFSSITQKLSCASCGSDTTSHPCTLPKVVLSALTGLLRVARAAPAHQPQRGNRHQPFNVEVKSQARQPPFTCFRGLTLSCCVSRSTSWGELSSCPCGWRARAATPAQPRHSPGAGTRAEASPTRSPTRGSLSSHRGWLLSCISLRKREKEMETINKLIFRGCTPVWVLWTGVNPQRCPFISAHQASQHGKLCKCRRWRCACCQCQYGVMSKTRKKNRMAKVITYSHTLQGQETQPTFGWQWVSSHATIASYRSCELSELQGCFKERHSTQWQWPYYSST